MTCRVRVLLVEDSPEDAELIGRVLRRGLQAVTITCVGSAAEMERALKGAEWDVVVADYRLPGFDALDALEIVQRLRLELPFIAVSSCAADETLVALMGRGARDFVGKDELHRLALAVRRELAARETRRSLARLEEQVAGAEQAAAVGTEAMTVAHDVNNLLAVVVTFSEKLSTQLDSWTPARAGVDAVSEVARTTAEGAHRLLAMSRSSARRSRRPPRRAS